MKHLSTGSTYAPGWNFTPTLCVTRGTLKNEYRLVEGRLEFRAGSHDKWRQLAYPEIQQHMVFGTAVAKWVAQLYTMAKLAMVLSA